MNKDRNGGRVMDHLASNGEREHAARVQAFFSQAPQAGTNAVQQPQDSKDNEAKERKGS